MCVVNWKETEQHHKTGTPMDRVPPGPKTDTDHLIKDNLSCYCPMTSERQRERRKGGAVGS